jgi:aerobic-type carbon monoxide dehydrogenase small subunit (CoxS/CutS family)
LCRCGTHLEIVKAVHRAAQYMAQATAQTVPAETTA